MKMSEKQETVEVTLKLPKALIDFLNAMDVNVEEYLVLTIVDNIAADLEADTFHYPKQLVEKHNLMPVFRRFNVSVSNYIDPEA